MRRIPVRILNHNLAGRVFRAFMGGLSIRKTARQFEVTENQVSDVIRQRLSKRVTGSRIYDSIAIRLTDLQRKAIFMGRASPLGCPKARFRVTLKQADMLFGWLHDELEDETDLIRRKALANFLNKLHVEEKRAAAARYVK